MTKNGNPNRYTTGQTIIQHQEEGQRWNSKCSNVCKTTFGVDQDAIGDDDLVTCPKCDSEVDVGEDRAEVR